MPPYFPFPPTKCLYFQSRRLFKAIPVMAFPQFSVVTSGPIYFAHRLAGKIHNVPPYCLCQIRHLLQMTLIWSHSTGRDLVQRRCLTKSFQTRLLAMLMMLHIRTYSVYMNVCGCIYTAFWRQLPLVLWLPLKAMTEEWIEPFIFVRQWWEWRMPPTKIAHHRLCKSMWMSSSHNQSLHEIRYIAVSHTQKTLPLLKV